MAVVSLFTMFVASLRSTLDDEVRAGITADFVVSTSSFGGGRLSPEVVADLRDRPEVGRAVGLGGGGVRTSDGADGESTTVVATDPAQLAAVMDVETVSGSLTDLGDRAIAVSADEAQDRGWRVGRPVTLTFAGGAHRARHRRRGVRRRGPARRRRGARRALVAVTPCSPPTTWCSSRRRPACPTPTSAPR